MNKTIEQLENNLYLTIRKQKYNKDLIKFLSAQFTKKGFASDIPTLIFSDKLPIKTLKKEHLIYFTVQMFSFLKDNNIKPTDYFSDKEILDVDAIKPKEVDESKTLVLKNVDQHPNGTLEYKASFWSIVDIYDAYNRGLLTYNMETQREATYIKTPSGAVLKKPTINEESVKDISEMMYKNEFKANLITLNVLKMEGKKPRMKYYKDKRELHITVDYDYSKENPYSTEINISDGFHRTDASIVTVMRAIKEGRDLSTLTDCLTVSVLVMTAEECNQYLSRENKQNKMSDEFIKSIASDELNKIVDMFNTQDSILRSNIAKTYQEMIATNKLTSYEVIRSAIKLTDINVSDEFDVQDKIPKMIKIIDSLINYLKKYKFGDITNMKNTSEFLNHNIFCGYVAIANKLVDKKDYVKDIMDIGNELYEMDFKSLNLKTKNPSYKKIYQYFEDFVEVN